MSAGVFVILKKRCLCEVVERKKRILKRHPSIKKIELAIGYTVIKIYPFYSVPS